MHVQGSAILRRDTSATSALRLAALAVLVLAGWAARAAGGQPATATPVPTRTPTPLGGNTATATPTPTSTRVHDLVLTGTASPEPVAAGSLLTYEFLATNDGPSQALSSSVTILLPSSVSFVSCTAMAPFPPATCGPTSQGAFADFSSSLQGGRSASVEVVVLVLAAAGSIQTTASFSSAGIDPNPANNVVTLTSTIQGGIPPTLTFTPVPTSTPTVAPPTSTPTPIGGSGGPGGGGPGSSIPTLSPTSLGALFLGLLAAGWFLTSRRA